MSDLKPGWRREKFGEVVRLNKETCKDPETAGINRVIGLEHLEPGDLRVRSWADVADGTTFSNRVRPGQVLFGKRRAYQRKVAVADFDAICSGDIYVFETADQMQLLQELLPYICQTDSFFEYAVGTSAGSLSPRTNWKSIAAYEFALPPLEEQRRIANLLIAVEHSLQCCARASRLAYDMSRRLLEAFDLTGLPFFPVKDLVTDGPSNGFSPRCNDQGIGRPTLPVGCVYSGVVNTSSELKYSQIDDHTFAKYQLHRDDVLVVRGNGNKELVGRAGIVTEQDSQCFYPDLLIRLRFDSARLDPNLAVLLWNCVPLHAALVGRAKSTNGIYKINGSDIREHCLPIPSATMQLEMLGAVAIHIESLRYIESRVALCSQMKSQLLNSLNETV